ncbi:MAG: SLC13 family permease [Rhodospirillaceae bacterium]|jgi:di/tricarboxylate transporter|nr:SLC13 family permease [Rhodospirillaceae bacterium]MBT5357514.1 SLC13 family permease [Rhodospirillaceae bacterium]MBT5770503.1 SLC13 family permease [Rhodospirillaceae bacterium]MBT6309019.1 SLC13 family permease [Rhodospirillaceae bacterium]MBT7363809.1 SLC13 family permease [Rhodospirillaceae bacterium]
MTTEQIIIFAILGLSLVFFMWGRWRYDVVAFTALILAVIGGVVPTDLAFRGFGHPAVITVAAVLVISRTLQVSGVIDLIAGAVLRMAKGQGSQMTALSGIGAVLSGFMNNVGALALLMPLALRLSKKPSAVLMPLSFATILGGLVTLIGTPPNIIVATYRTDVVGEPFALFDFAFVGLPIALIGLIFVLLIGWRLIPAERTGRRSAEEMFDLDSYVVEVSVDEESEFMGKTVRELEALDEDRSIVVGLLRDDTRRLTHIWGERLRAGDLLLLRVDPATLDDLLKKAGLTLTGAERLKEENIRSDQVGTIEAVVQPGARVEGRSPQTLGMRRRFGVALLALAREGQPVRERLARVQFRAGDVLLLQGDEEELADAVAEMGCLPLAERRLTVGKPRAVMIPILIFTASVLSTVMGWTPVHVSFAAAVVALILLNRISANEAYQTIEWPVIVLLGAMIPLGNALQSTGGTQLIAESIVGLSGTIPIWAVLTIVLVVTMTLSDLMNNAATAIVMAPISVAIAQQLGVNADPFLMAVAIGASCAFLTPIGHQNNVLVMGPGGYRFGDYWRMGLPLEIIIVATSVPLILIFWPL